MFAPWKKSYDKPGQLIKNQRHYFPDKGPYSQSYIFFPVVMYGCESRIPKESWVLKSWFWIVVLEKTLESLLDCKEIQPANPKGNQPWIFIGRTDAETEAIILWPPDVKSHQKYPDVGKDWSKREGEEDRGGKSWIIASLTHCTWVWANSGRQWRTGKPGMLQSTGSQKISGTRVGDYITT